MFLNPQFSFISASPDAVVSCACCGTGVCGVKCPYNFRDTSLIEFQDLNIPYLEYDDGYNLRLKRNRDYYHQIQTQIFVRNANHGYFVIWTHSARWGGLPIGFSTIVWTGSARWGGLPYGLDSSSLTPSVVWTKKSNYRKDSA